MFFRHGIHYWLLLDYNIIYVLSYSILQPIFLFFEIVIHVMKAK